MNYIKCKRNVYYTPKASKYLNIVNSYDKKKYFEYYDGYEYLRHIDIKFLRNVKPQLYERLKRLEAYDVNGYEKIFGNFPTFKQALNIEDMFNKSGFLLIIDYEEINNLNKHEFAKRYRSKLKNFDYIIILSDEPFKECDVGRQTIDNLKFSFDRYTHIGIANRMYFEYSLMNVGDGVERLLDIYINHIINLQKSSKKITDNKREILNKIIQLLGKSDLTTTQIQQDLDISVRSVERYMNDIKYIGIYIGYNKSSKKWYLCR